MKFEFLLDTCVLSEASRPKPDHQTLDFIDNRIARYAASPTVMELMQGITPKAICSSKKALELLGWYNENVLQTCEIIPTCRKVAEVWGQLCAEPRLRGFLSPNPAIKKIWNNQKLQIAATAIVHRLPIATFNTKDFVLINSVSKLAGVYNPKFDSWAVAPDIRYATMP